VSVTVTLRNQKNDIYQCTKGDKDNIGVPPPRGVKAGLAAIGSQADRIGQCPTSVCLQLRSNTDGRCSAILCENFVHKRET
jgi:hypothetical protein